MGNIYVTAAKEMPVEPRTRLHLTGALCAVERAPLLAPGRGSAAQLKLRLRAAFAPRHQRTYFLQPPNTASRTQGGAVQRGHGIAEIQSFPRTHAAENSITKGSV